MKMNLLAASALVVTTLAGAFAHAADAWQVIPKGQWEVVMGDEGDVVVDSLFSVLATTQFKDCVLKDEHNYGFAKLDIYVTGKKELSAYISNQKRAWGVARRLSPQPSIQLFTYADGGPMTDTPKAGFFTKITTDISGRKITKFEVIEYANRSVSRSDRIAYSGSTATELQRTINVSCTAK